MSSKFYEPACKKCRRAKAKLYLKGSRCETAKCAIEKRPITPGFKGGVVRKLSEYGRRLREKQKLRFFYGISETQSQNYFDEAARVGGVTGENLLRLLEQRLDNVVFRSGLALSRRHARQLVLGGHFTVNGKKVTSPGRRIKPTDIVGVKSSKAVAYGAIFEKVDAARVPGWIKVDAKSKSVQLEHTPDAGEIDTPVEVQLIVEYYAR